MFKRTILFFGLTVCLGATACAQELTTNGGFETGDLTGWTLGGSASAFVTTSPVHSGTYSAKLTPGTSDNILYQTINTTAGDVYSFSVWLIDTGRAGDSSDFDKLYWDGNIVPGSPTFVPGDSVWHNYSFDLQATGSTTQIGVEAYNPSGNYFLDDVSVMAAPAPEPASLSLIALGAVALFRRRQAR